MSHGEDDPLGHEIFYIIIRKLLRCYSHHDGEEFGVRGNNLELASRGILNQVLAMNAFFDCGDERAF
jgi:hypothetical protein